MSVLLGLCWRAYRSLILSNLVNLPTDFGPQFKTGSLKVKAGVMRNDFLSFLSMCKLQRIQLFTIKKLSSKSFYYYNHFYIIARFFLNQELGFLK